MYALYQDGYSLAQVGQVWGLTRQSVYDMFKRRGWPLRERKFLPTVTYLGETYTPDPDGYFRKTNRDRKWLHHAVWEHHRGPIPPGHDIHHRDENKANNDIDNLLCVTASEHGSIHNPYAPTPTRNCLWCRKPLVRQRQPSGRLETPAEVGRRLYCGSACHSAHRRGKPRGWGPRHEDAART
jgi:hypothetical protein